ncbi:hypothetical protein HHK36_015616 [Tetracentron sinense]|uniref:Uncharacterized protein n=1 Tax=Tetracentron sinense TaxID=13715 RepID=A0A834Z5A1_TETSI|nr:hypothetical protein HHK36_015616 [Tetracentron sinense]
MASHSHLDDEDDFGGDYPGSHSTRRPGKKRSFGDLDDDEDDIFGSKKGNTKLEETAPGVATGMILSLRESLQNCKDTLATCQYPHQIRLLLQLEKAVEVSRWSEDAEKALYAECATSLGCKLGYDTLCNGSQHINAMRYSGVALEIDATVGGAAATVLNKNLLILEYPLHWFQTEHEAAKSEIQKWHSAFQNESFIPAGTSPEPGLVVSYLQTLKSSEEMLKEQLEKAKKKEAAFIVTFAKREQEIAELKSAVRDLKVQLKPPSMQARRLLLDPAIHEEFTRLKNLVEEKEKKVKELQDNVAAVNFTPQSKMGKMLMAKCRTLQEENEEIGTLASEGKIHELAMKLALQKSQNAELRSQFEGHPLRRSCAGLMFDPLVHGPFAIGAEANRHLTHCSKVFETGFGNVIVVDNLLIVPPEKFEKLEGLYKHMDGLTNDMEKSNELVLDLQERLEEKDSELKRLRHELYQKELMEEVKIDSAGDNKMSDEVDSGEA